MRVLTICRPMLGGLYSVVLSLRRALEAQRADLRWIAAGKSIAIRAREDGTADDLKFGTLLATDTDNEIAKADALIDHIGSVNPDAVIFHVLGGILETNLARYLPGSIRRVIIAHSITPATYRAARSIRDWVHAAVGVSPRIASDLVRFYGFDPAWTCAIPNAVNLTEFQRPARRARTGGALRVLSLGRVEHGAKGVLWLPDIIQRTIRAGGDLTLTVAGDGPDLARLKAETVRHGLDGRARFLGPVPRRLVPGLMAEHDVLLFPSIYEGFGLTLIEAMAAGCVPVAALIHGVTDAIIDDGQTGLLFPVASPRRAAERLLWLYRDADAVTALSRAAAIAARKYGFEPHGAAYYALLRHTVESPRPICPPLALAEWEISPLLGSGWRRFVPPRIKHFLRVVRERV